MPLNTQELLKGMSVPHLDQYFGVWAIREDVLRSALVKIEKMDLRAHVELHQAPVPAAKGDESEAAGNPLGASYEVTAEGVALIELSGPLMKFVSSLSAGTSTVAARRQLRAATQDERVKAIAIRIDSPGGTVSGTKDMADDIAAAAAKKPVLAYIEDLGCSAAYWAASQCTTISCNPTAIVGSIGTYTYLVDYSGAAKKKGIAVHVVKAGDMKGAGVEGTPVTDEQLAEMQRLVNSLNSHFVEAVAAGRKMSLASVKAMADGRVHVGTEAKALGLVDAVQSFEAAVASLVPKQSKPAGSRAAETILSPLSQEEPIVADTPTPAPKTETAPAPQVASFEQLKTAFPKASAEFLCDQLGKKATLEQSSAAYTAAVEARADSQAKELEQLKAQQNKPGVSGITDRPAGSAAKSEADAGGDPIANWNAAVDAKLKVCGGDKAKAVRMVARENPELHQSYVEAYNLANQKSRRQVGAK